MMTIGHMGSNYHHLIEKDELVIVTVYYKIGSNDVVVV